MNPKEKPQPHEGRRGYVGRYPPRHGRTRTILSLSHKHHQVASFSNGSAKVQRFFGSAKNKNMLYNMFLIFFGLFAQKRK